jgi:O-acetyl-ADP-ribose deacetylase (regulator of RNase III)
MAVPIEIDVWQGDIAELEVDAIIVPANESLFMTTPIARAVKRRAGDAVELEAVHQGPIEAGSAIVTGGGLLAATYVIHAVGVGHDLKADGDRLERALDAAFSAAERLGLTRLAAAPIGVERGVFTVEDAAAHLAAVVARRAADGAWLPSSLVLAVTLPGEVAAMRAALQPIRSAG